MDTYLEKITNQLESKITKRRVYQGELTITAKSENLYPILKILKDEYQFDYLADIHSVDHFDDDDRFEISYNICNLTEKKRLRVKAYLPEENPHVKSVVDIWKSANWFEREVFDMMDIKFTDHPDLRRIYMPEDFEFYPLRKEFPLIGIPGSIQIPDKGPEKPYK